jgi:GNAT superfamily N-acetyltransferase
VIIRALDPVEDLAKVVQFYCEAPEYWLLADRVPPGPTKAVEFFTDGPPNCDVSRSHRLGMFLDGRLSGVAELSVGFPEPDDFYLGLLMLGAWAQGAGYGKTFLTHLEGLARQSEATQLYLAVLDENPRGWAFWTREGFEDTGLSGENMVEGRPQKLHRLVKHL